MLCIQVLLPRLISQRTAIETKLLNLSVCLVVAKDAEAHPSTGNTKQFSFVHVNTYLHGHAHTHTLANPLTPPHTNTHNHTSAVPWVWGCSHVRLGRSVGHPVQRQHPLAHRLQCRKDLSIFWHPTQQRADPCRPTAAGACNSELVACPWPIVLQKLLCTGSVDISCAVTCAYKRRNQSRFLLRCVYITYLTPPRNLDRFLDREKTSNNAYAWHKYACTTQTPYRCSCAMSQRRWETIPRLWVSAFPTRLGSTCKS